MRKLGETCAGVAVDMGYMQEWRELGRHVQEWGDVLSDSILQYKRARRAWPEFGLS